MAIRITSKEAKNLTFEEEKACSKLVSTGSIFNLYTDCCSPDKKIKNRVFLAKENGKVIGWCIIKERAKYKLTKYEFMIYIKRKYRRMGIGTKMYNRSKKFFKLKDGEILVYTTDKANKQFFNKVRNL